MNIRIAGIVKGSVVDGPGIRAVVFAQGCPRNCPGCHNPDALDPLGGEEMDIEEIVGIVTSDPFVRGVSFSGGDPFAQAMGFAQLAEQLKKAGKHILTFTGYTWEELLRAAKEDTAVERLIESSDIIVDGPFLEEEKDLGLAFRGSKNQRIIDVAKSMAKGEVILCDYDSRG